MKVGDIVIRKAVIGCNITTKQRQDAMYGMIVEVNKPSSLGDGSAYSVKVYYPKLNKALYISEVLLELVSEGRR